ncbi:hypothetical protein DOY81_010134, partial [Sarcophaga bullata]
RVMGMDEKLHQKIFEDNLSLIDTPLIATTTNTIYHPGAGSSSATIHGYKDIQPYPYPINLTEFYHRHNMAQEVTIIPDVIDTGIGYSSGPDVEENTSTDIIKQHFQSTCHTALDTCREDPSCLSSLQPMLQHCEMHRCNRNACMTSLQAFYKGPHEDLNLDVAFCLCKTRQNIDNSSG